MRELIFVITGLSYGGAETQLLRIAILLKKRGWSIRVISLTPPKAYLEEFEAEGIPINSLEIRRKLPDPRPMISLVRLIRSLKPDIVHGFMVHANLLARLVRPMAHVPVLICSARNTDEGGYFRELLYRLTDPLSDLTTQVSSAGVERYIRVGAVPEHKICLIPNGVDIENFRPDPEARNHIRDKLKLNSKFVWISVGRLESQKDYPNMLEAYAHVVHGQQDTCLLIVGDGKLCPVIKTLADDLCLMDRVQFLGIRRDVSQLLNAADGYLMSSAWEGMANVLLEASATGLPIVSTDVGGNREVVLNGKTGFLVPPMNSGALAEAMTRLMGLTEEERHGMGKAGRLYIETTYSLDKVVDAWESLYIKLLEQKNRK